VLASAPKLLIFQQQQNLFVHENEVGCLALLAMLVLSLKDNYCRTTCKVVNAYENKQASKQVFFTQLQRVLRFNVSLLDPGVWCNNLL
jgi:hypothetical protein